MSVSNHVDITQKMHEPCKFIDFIKYDQLLQVLRLQEIYIHSRMK